MTTKITEQNISNLANLGVQWQAIHVADGSTALTVSAGKGYFIDTTSAAQTVNLPANASSTAGDTIVLRDYARKWGTNAVTLASNTFDGTSNTVTFNTEGQTVTLVHSGTTKGWLLLNEDTTSQLGVSYVSATGGTVTTSGNFKIHSFTGDGNFVVSSVGSPSPHNAADYIVVAGGAGGAGGSDRGGGGGAGGFRGSAGTSTGSYTAGPSPVVGSVPAITLSAQTYPITVGAGGAGRAHGPHGSGAAGSNSVFSTITSAGGGSGAHDGGGGNGGSGGGAGTSGGSQLFNGGSGNTPPVSPPQGNNGGPNGTQPLATGGGGGATSNGGTGAAPASGSGGDDIVNHITGSPVAYAGGGGGGGQNGGAPSGPGSPGGSGTAGGATGSSPPHDAANAAANRGGGGGGAGNRSGGHAAAGGNGGKGVVIIRYKYQN